MFLFTFSVSCTSISIGFCDIIAKVFLSHHSSNLKPAFLVIVCISSSSPGLGIVSKCKSVSVPLLSHGNAIRIKDARV